MLATSTEIFSAQHSITMTCIVKGPLRFVNWAWINKLPWF